MEQIWLTWAKQLQAIASTGVHFANDPYDRERYTRVVYIAQQMLSALGSVPIKKSKAWSPILLRVTQHRALTCAGRSFKTIKSCWYRKKRTNYGACQVATPMSVFQPRKM